jgi:fused signal recognition particle receptor
VLLSCRCEWFRQNGQHRRSWANRRKLDGKKVMVAACDTFRAAAVEQLTVWSERIGVDIVKQKQGSDPAAVAHDACEAAEARGIEVLIVDTAGRLHTQSHLMRRVEKIHRVVTKQIRGRTSRGASRP